MSDSEQTAHMAEAAGGPTNRVAPEPQRQSFVAEMHEHIDVMLRMSRQLPQKSMQEPETEGTVFQRFLSSLSQTVQHLKVN
eukprot:9472072-Pyramimonas_sp.AAC.1